MAEQNGAIESSIGHNDKGTSRRALLGSGAGLLAASAAISAATFPGDALAQANTSSSVSTNTAGSGVRWMREAVARNGKMPAALGVAHQLVAFAKQNLGLHVQVFFDIAGTFGTIRWMVDFANLSEYERVIRGLETNGAYKAIVDDPAVSAIFIEGSTRDTLLLSA